MDSPAAPPVLQHRGGDRELQDIGAYGKGIILDESGGAEPTHRDQPSIAHGKSRTAHRQGVGRERRIGTDSIINHGTGLLRNGD